MRFHGIKFNQDAEAFSRIDQSVKLQSTASVASTGTTQKGSTAVAIEGRGDAAAAAESLRIIINGGHSIQVK